MALVFAPTLSRESGFANGKVMLIQVDETINPATAEYILNSISKAEGEQASALVIEMNTPGGLLESTRKIVQGILGSVGAGHRLYRPERIACRVGGRLHYAFCQHRGHGSGHEHRCGSSCRRRNAARIQLQWKSQKVTNDAAAFVRAIAQKRHRNVAWAEECRAAQHIKF